MLLYSIYCHLTIPTKAACNNQVHTEPNLSRCCGCHGLMFSELSTLQECPDSWCAQSYIVFRKVPECIWGLLLIGEHGPGVCTVLCMNQSLAMSVLIYLLRNMQQCTQECRIWGESAHYTKRM